MEFNDLWEIIEEKNHSLGSGVAKMSTAGFKRALRLAYDKGVESVPKNDFSDVFLKGFRK